MHRPSPFNPEASLRDALDLEREKNRQLEDLIRDLEREALLPNSLALCGHQAVAYNALERYGQVSKQSMFSLVYRDDPDPPAESELRSLICALRKKLPESERISTVWGWGWRFHREKAPKTAKATRQNAEAPAQPIHTLGINSAGMVSSLAMG